MDNTIRDRMLESWEWLEVECDCDNLTICQNHRDMAEIVGPIGVLVVVVAWAIISRRHGNGSSDRYQVVVAKLDGLRDDIGEVKDRKSVV